MTNKVSIALFQRRLIELPEKLKFSAIKARVCWVVHNRTVIGRLFTLPSASFLAAQTIS